MKDYSKTPLIELHKLCDKGDQEALKEWQRRWITEYPSMGIVKAKRPSQEVE